MGFVGTSGTGLTQKDKDTIKNWMVEGHSVQNGRVMGNIPFKKGNIIVNEAVASEGQVKIKIPEKTCFEKGSTIQVNMPNLKQANIKNDVNINGLIGSFPAGYTIVAYAFGVGAYDYAQPVNPDIIDSTCAQSFYKETHNDRKCHACKIIKSGYYSVWGRTGGDRGRKNLVTPWGEYSSVDFKDKYIDASSPNNYFYNYCEASGKNGQSNAAGAYMIFRKVTETDSVT